MLTKLIGGLIISWFSITLKIEGSSFDFGHFSTQVLEVFFIFFFLGSLLYLMPLFDQWLSLTLQNPLSMMLFAL